MQNVFAMNLLRSSVEKGISNFMARNSYNNNSSSSKKNMKETILSALQTKSSKTDYNAK